jgi:pimeloyl-ACP methyl ester carboxylesterase
VGGFLGLTLLPPVQARGKAVAVLVDGLGVGLPRPFAATVTRVETRVDGVLGDLWSPSWAAPPIVLLPGAAPRGRADTRVRAVARALARAGRAVFVPEMELSHARFERSDINATARAVAALRQGRLGERGNRPRVVLLGFSFGGSFALLVAAHPVARQQVAGVATFGSYFDLRGVLQAATTGVSVVGERRVAWRADPRAARVVRTVAGALVAVPERAALAAALRGTADPARLPAGARAAYDVVMNTSPDRTYPLAARLDPTGQALLADFSPAAVAARITAPVVAMHSRDDPLVPYGELLRLERGLPHAVTRTVSSFMHVDLQAGGSVPAFLRDLWEVWSFASFVLSVQETWFDKVP